VKGRQAARYPEAEPPPPPPPSEEELDPATESTTGTGL
jgi:hypothetical protein